MNQWLEEVRKLSRRFKAEQLSQPDAREFIKSSSAYKNFVRELHRYWHAYFKSCPRNKPTGREHTCGILVRQSTVSPGYTWTQNRCYLFKHVFLREHGGQSSGRDYNGEINALRTRARRMIMCEPCARSDRQKIRCNECQPIRNAFRRKHARVMCLDCREATEDSSTGCQNMGRCVTKIRKWIAENDKSLLQCGCTIAMVIS